MLRCNEPGYVCVANFDGRRGVWIRTSSDCVEICAGREGDDEYVKLEKNQIIDEETLYNIKSIFDAIAYAAESSR